AAHAAVPGVDHHRVTDGESVDARTERIDGAGHVGAQHERIAELEVRQPAPTAMRTSPAPGCGSGSSSTRSTSGPPCSRSVTAFMINPRLFAAAVVAAAEEAVAGALARRAGADRGGRRAIADAAAEAEAGAHDTGRALGRGAAHR